MQFTMVAAETRFILGIDACSSPACVKHQLRTAVRPCFNLNEISDKVSDLIFSPTRKVGDPVPYTLILHGHGTEQHWSHTDCDDSLRFVVSSQRCKAQFNFRRLFTNSNLKI
jgi:hypothetical protein